MRRRRSLRRRFLLGALVLVVLAFALVGWIVQGIRWTVTGSRRSRGGWARAARAA